MTPAPPHRLLVGLTLIGGMGCASAPYAMVPHRITLREWGDVVECVTLAARADGKEVFVESHGVRVPITVNEGRGLDDIQFVWGEHPSAGFAVMSRIKSFDYRYGGRETMEGPLPETRRLRQQLDQQCLRAYPAVERTGA